MTNFDDDKELQDIKERFLQEVKDHQERKVETRTWSYYEKMRKEKPKEYWRSGTQAQMLKDYQALGTSFEDGSFGED